MDTAEQQLADSQTVRVDDDGRPIIKTANCGYCGRSWNDAAISARTPTPAGRCPFEYEHEYAPDALEVATGDTRR